MSRSMDSIPGGRSKIARVFQPKKENTKQKQYCHKFKRLKLIHIKKKKIFKK